MKKMSSLALLAAAAFLTSGAARAATFYVAGLCGSFAESNFSPPPNSGSGFFTCPTAASLGVTTVSGEFIVYSSDYSSGLADTVTTVTNWTFGGTTFSFQTDTTTVTGGTSSNAAVSTDGLSYNQATNLPPLVLGGFYDTTFDFTGTPTVSYVTQATAGSALEGTGYAQIVYAYTTSTGPPNGSVPEPAAWVLMGTGLVAVFSARRRSRCL